MTHEELLEILSHTAQDGMADEPILLALKAVVELITKEDTIPLDDYHFGYMDACKAVYEAIEKELS